MASWDRKLLTAAVEGNIKEVEICVKNGANLEWRGGFGWTPLMFAAGGGQLEVVTFLVNHGSQLEVTDSLGRTPLMLAAGGGHLEVVTFLVSHGSQLEATDENGGQTPLMWAAERGHLEVVTFLVTRGSQLEATSRFGMTPLMLAAEGGHLEVVTFLVTHGSQLEVTSTRSGRTALHYAAEYGEIDTTKWLVDQGCSPWMKTKEGKTPYDLVNIESYDDEEGKRKKEEVMDFLKTVMLQTPEGISSSGFAQANVQLKPEIKYFSSVRAVTNEGNVLEAVSDGFTVDTSPPVVTLDRLTDKDASEIEGGSSIYQKTVDSLSALWHYSDEESGIQRAWFSVGTYPFGADVAPVTEVNITPNLQSSLPLSTVVADTSGETESFPKPSSKDELRAFDDQIFVTGTRSVQVSLKKVSRTRSIPDLSTLRKKAKGSLLTTGIYCDGYFIDCDVHQSLIGSYRLFRKTGKGDIPISKCMKLESMNEFENLVIASSYLKNEQGCSSILNEKSFLQAVDKSQDLLCRLMLSYFGYSEKNVVYLAKALRFAIEKRHDTISMGIAWHLTWIYYKQNQSAFPSLVDIWPAVRCSCTNESEYKNDICSSEAVIVVQLDTDAAQPSVMFFSIEVIYFTNLMDETLPFANRIIPYSDHIPITGSSAEMLFDSHRNLTLICKSSCLTSKEPCRPSNTQFEITACVKLYCKAKGFIPIGEEHFPKIFCGMRTTVVQGTPTLMTGMQIGKKVGTDNFKKGTLGGFVRFRGENAFLTCLHVFLTAEELTADYITLDDTESYHVKYYQNTTEASNKDDGIVCGKIQVFGFGKNSEGTSIDAALIQLEKGIPIDSSHFTATTGLQSCYLNDICIDYNSLRHGFPGPTISIVSIGAVSGNSKINFNVMVQKPVDIDIDAFKKSINDIILEGMRDHVVAVMQALHSWSDIRTPVRDRIRISVNKICSAEMLAETKESIAEIVCRIFPETLNHENCDQIEKIDKLLHEATFEQTSSRFSAIVSDVHMQTTVLKRTVESAKRMSYKIYKQIYIPGIPFEMGDSGTCLYVHDRVNPNTKGCIGMAIAKHPDGGCIATPIMEILKHFQIRFKDCY